MSTGKKLLAILGLAMACLYAQTAHATTCACDTFFGNVGFNGGTVSMNSNLTVGSTGLGHSLTVTDGWILATSSGAGPVVEGYVNSTIAVKGWADGGVGGVGGYFKSGDKGVVSEAYTFGLTANASSVNGVGVAATAPGSSGIALTATGAFKGAVFSSTNTTGTAYGIMSSCVSNNCTAVWAGAPSGQTAVYASGNAIVSQNFTAYGTGYFGGYITKAGGGWRDDHPLKPETHMLNHGFVESDVMRNVYVGEVVLDASGSGVIAMAEWFPAVNGAPVVFTNADDGSPVKRVKVDATHWRLRGKAGIAVSWQVTAPRADAWTRAHQPPTEIVKSAAERGRFMHPELHGAGPEKQL